MQRSEVQKVRDMIEGESNLVEVLEQHGFECRIGGARFGEGHATFKLEVHRPGASKEQGEFAAFAAVHGLDPEDYGLVVVMSGDTYKLVGYRHRSTKYPFICERVRDQKRYKFPVEAVRHAVAKAKAAPRGADVRF